MPSSLRTTRIQTAHADHASEENELRSFPGLHAVDNTYPSILAGVSIHYMRGMTPVANKGEWRPKRSSEQAKEQLENPPQGG
jgi:hypothetical protein